jgi:hypothetical protein
MAETFGTLPKLRQVRIGDRCIGQFTRALMYEPTSYKSQSLSFPALQSIFLTEVSFLECEDGDQRPIGVDPDKLIECLRKRCVLGSRLKLTLLRCFYVNEMVVQRLREVVDDVEWDRVEAKDILGVFRKRS